VDRIVGVFAGSKSDIPRLEKGLGILDELGISYRLTICSAHRDPERLRESVKVCEKEGAVVYIAVAGLAAHLPGVIASMTIKPVIGVPIDAALGGLDSLLSIVQMPPGVPVAAVGVDNSRNAALLAAEIIATSDGNVAEKLSLFREKARDSARADNQAQGGS